MLHRETRVPVSPGPLASWAFLSRPACLSKSGPRWRRRTTRSSPGPLWASPCWLSTGSRNWTCRPAPDSPTPASPRCVCVARHPEGAASQASGHPLHLLFQVVRHPDLHRLSLSALSDITDASLVSVARRCPCLSSLALSHCPGISDHGVAQAAPYLHRLQHLYLSCCNNVTDRRVTGAAFPPPPPCL